MSTLSTHILDTSIGLPAEGVRVSVARQDSESWHDIGSGVTDSDGRVAFGKDLQCETGTYRLRFDVLDYHRGKGVKGFYPFVEIVFALDADELSHYHVPLLLNPFGYSTYRGS